MRPPVADIMAPPFPPGLRWVNSTPLRAAEQGARAALVEFWDFCRVNSLRTLPYLIEWHDRYASAGLRVIGVHSPGFEPSRDEDATRAAVPRLGVDYAVVLDPDLRVWQLYENPGWPGRYLFDANGVLRDFHHGEGGYEETELAIQELVGVSREPVAPLRPEAAPGARLAPQTADQPGAWSGAYEAGGVWAVLDGAGVAQANGRSIEVHHPGCYALVEHDRHTAGELALELGDGVRCHAICFTPGVV